MTLPTPQPLSCVGTARCAVQARSDLTPDHIRPITPSAFHVGPLRMGLLTASRPAPTPTSPPMAEYLTSASG